MSSPRPTLAVSACLLRGGRVLLVKRRHAPLKGLFSLPGGRVEFGERVEDAVRREVLEETGVSVSSLGFLCLHEVIEAVSGHHAVIAVYTGQIADDERPSAASDAAEVVLANLEEIEEMERRGLATWGLSDIVRSALAR